MSVYSRTVVGTAIGCALSLLIAWGISVGAQQRGGGGGGQRAADAKPGDVRMMVTAAIQTPFEAVRAEMQKAIGKPLVIEYGSARGNLKEEILAGQGFQVAVLLPDVNEELEKAGKIVHGSFTIARVDVAFGLRGDVTVDVSTPAAIRNTLLKAKSARWSDTGAALLTVNKILDTLGIREALKAAHAMPGNTPLGPGEYEMNIYPLSEILANKNVKNLEPVIPELQVPSIIDAVISSNTPDMASAKALIKFLQGPRLDPDLKASGMKR